ncbi:hypothetical protein RCL_jg28163.t1 [Rhizophagus clarus]|uniref:Uncharacterized protein n=1 Tax=Rhizophagus clarus TaxID=94130 RepID=A0A8H3LTP7_9GLOM|nr:hypothetical protein RCL_jg28163.t1 [Rhizophagus clarus]
MIRQMSSNARAKKKLRSVNGINRFKNQRNGITMTHGGMSPPPPYTVNDRMVYEQRLRKLYGEVGCDHSGGLYSISYNISLCKWCIQLWHTYNLFTKYSNKWPDTFNS